MSTGHVPLVGEAGKTPLIQGERVPYAEAVATYQVKRLVINAQVLAISAYSLGLSKNVNYFLKKP